MNDPRPEEFIKFHELLADKAPDEYTPWYFRCERGGKAPDISYGSWKDESAQLSPAEAVQWMQSGGNVGIAGTDKDRLVNVDIDDEDETSIGDLKPTLIARSRSRTGVHAWYFSERPGALPNIPTDDAGEVRTMWQFVVAPGSYVKTDPAEVPDSERENAGYYTIERAEPVAAIALDELPHVFRETRERDETRNQELKEIKEDYTPPEKSDGNSALFEVTAEDVARMKGPAEATQTNGRWGSIFHGSDTGKNMSLSDKNEGTLNCWRHNVAHNGIQALAVLSDYEGGCKAVGSPHKDSGVPVSCLHGDDAHIWYAWKYAKEQGYIPKDDPVPYRALIHLVREMDVASAGEIPEEYDPDNDKRLPAYAYNLALATIENRDGLQSGREKVGENESQTVESVFSDKDSVADEGGEKTNDTNTSDDPTTGDLGMPATPDNNDRDYWGDIRDSYRGAEKDERKKPRHDAGRLLQRERHYATHEQTDALWVYDAASGTYEDRGEPVVRERLVEKLDELYSMHERREILDQIRGRSTYREEEFGGGDGLLCLKNGVLDVSDPTAARALDEHNPDHLFIEQAPVEYDPQADCPQWHEFLQDAVNSESERMKLQEYVGYCLMNWALPYHKAVFLVGPTASGKSTFLDTINGLLGEAVTSLTPQQLVDEQYSSWKLHGAWANISNEIPTDLIRNTGAFKEIVAGDEIKAEQKYQDPMFFKPTTKHLFAANQLPDADVDDNAFYRRIILIPFPTSVPVEQRDPALGEKLQTEFSGILNWALDGLDRLRKQHRFTAERTPGETRETWQSWGSTVDRFKQRCLDYQQDGTVPKAKLYDIYLRYCEAEGIPAETQNKLTRTLKQDSEINDGRATVDGRQKRCYIGVDINEDRLPTGVDSLDKSDDREGGTGTDLGRFD